MHIDRYERYWLIAVAATLGAFFAALIATLVVFGVSLPSPVGRVDPQNLAASEFAEPSVRNIGGNRYEAHIVARMWQFDAGPEAGTPPRIRVPAGSEVAFFVTSRDIMHGLYIQYHTINLEVIPGQVSQATVKFNQPGVYQIICNHYCGSGHAVMYGEVIVE